MLARAEARLASTVASIPGTKGLRGLLYGFGGFALSLIMIGAGLFVLAPRVGFNIFRPQKDSTEIAVEYTFDPGTTIEEARSLALEVNQAAAIGDRTPAPRIVEERLDPLAAEVDGARVVFNQVSAGPPEALFPFQVQIFGDDPDVVASAGAELAAALEQATIERPNGTTFSVVETTLGLTEVVARQDGRPAALRPENRGGPVESAGSAGSVGEMTEKADEGDTVTV